jgi:hypothetical protein
MSLNAQLGADLPHAFALTAEFRGAFGYCLSFGRGLATRRRGPEKLIKIGVSGKVPDDGLHRAHMQPESVRNGRRTEPVKEVSTANLESPLNRTCRLFK